jgi:hypothetical protein
MVHNAKETIHTRQRIELKLICALIVLLVMVFATPVLADKSTAPGQLKKQGNNDYGNVDCSKIKDDDARERCREEKYDKKKNKDSDKDYSDVDCSRIKDDDARERCREEKYDKKKNKDSDKDYSDVDCSRIKDDDARRRCREEKFDRR